MAKTANIFPNAHFKLSTQSKYDMTDAYYKLNEYTVKGIFMHSLGLACGRS